MQTIKFIKRESNELDFDSMTLINIISNNNNVIYYFICDYTITFRGKVSIEKEIIEFDEQDYQYIKQFYKIA